ncbi:hypothetical protein [Devosia sp. 2618]|uniref:hypothetical protein n=1 Tax=Devosia sp. 2618 TaxID=3156454 RepID=UPI003390FCCD
MRLVSFAAAAIALSSLTLPAFAQSEEAVMAQIESLHGQSEEFGELFGSIQDAFLFDNPTNIADLAFYPLDIAANGELYEIEDPQDLVDNFDALVSSETQAGLSSQDFSDLIVNSDGVGFANGALWASLVCSDDSCSSAEWGIIRINN